MMIQNTNELKAGGCHQLPKLTRQAVLSADGSQKRPPTANRHNTLAAGVLFTVSGWRATSSLSLWIMKSWWHGYIKNWIRASALDS